MIQFKRQIFWIIGLLAVCLAGLHCRIDHGLEPITSKIGGTIHFVGGVPPNTDEVRVAVVKDFPPESINQLLFSDMIDYRHESAPWEIYVSPGQYAMALVVWKRNNESWNLSDIIGIYGGSFIGDLLIPTYLPVKVPNSSSVVDTINMTANLNRVNRDASIEGTITFHGTWPANTGIVGVGAFAAIPTRGNFIDYYFKNVALDYNVPPFTDSYHYRLRVRSTDVLKYIAVLWINNSYDLASIQDIGYYRDPSDSTKHGEVAMSAAAVQNIDINVNFEGAGGAP